MAMAASNSNNTVFIVLDMDNCWLAEVKKLYERYQKMDALFQGITIQHSDFPIISSAMKKISDNNPKKVFVATGSNRQSLQAELENADKILESKGYEKSKNCRFKMACFSSHHALLLMVDILRILCPDRKVYLFEFCLADFLVTNHRDSQDISRMFGKTFHDFGNFYDKNNFIFQVNESRFPRHQTIQGEFPDGYPLLLAIDENKRILLYFLIHVACLLCKIQGQVVFYFYDDIQNIVDSLAQQYSLATNLLPKNCVLHLQHYKSERQYQQPPIIDEKSLLVGTGLCNSKPYETYHKFIDICKNHEGYIASSGVDCIADKLAREGKFSEFILNIYFTPMGLTKFENVKRKNFLINLNESLITELKSFEKKSFINHDSIYDEKFLLSQLKEFKELSGLFNDIVKKVQDDCSDKQQINLAIVQNIDPFSSSLRNFKRAINAFFKLNCNVSLSFIADLITGDCEKKFFNFPGYNLESSLKFPLAIYCFLQNQEACHSANPGVCYVYGANLESLRLSSDFYFRNRSLVPKNNSLIHCLLKDNAVITGGNRVDGSGEVNPKVTEIFDRIKPHNEIYGFRNIESYLQALIRWHHEICASNSRLEKTGPIPEDWELIDLPCTHNGARSYSN